jgi:hypothetical protein
LCCKPGITAAKVRIRDIGVELLLGTGLEVFFAVGIAVSTQDLARKILGPQAKGLHVRFGSLQHGRHMPIVLSIAKGFRMHDDLMFGIDQGLAIVTLQDAVGGEHLRRLVIRDITLQLLTLLPAFGVMRR